VAGKLLGYREAGSPFSVKGGQRLKLIQLEWQVNCSYVSPGLGCQETTTRAGAVGFRAQELKMQLLLLVGSIVLSVGAALGTASLFLSLLLRIMSKLR
jgi:hypothetical protein